MASWRTIWAIQGYPGIPHRAPWGPDLDFYCFFHGFWGPLGTQFGPSFVVFADLSALNCSIGSRVEFLSFEAGNCTRIRYLDVRKT